MPEAGIPGLIGAGLIGVAVGLVFGAVILAAMQRRSGASQKELERLKEEHERYRAEVNQHFAKTSDLFRDVTERYRDLYEHMAIGARQLCRDQPQASALDIPDKALLGEDEYAPATEAPRTEGGGEHGAVGERRSNAEEEET